MSKKPIAWSFSRLETFRQCPYKYYRIHMCKGTADHVDPYDGPKPEAMLYGDRLHKAMENAIMYGAEIPDEFQGEMRNKMEEKIAEVRAMLGAEARIVCEDQSAITVELKPTGWFDKNAWGRAVSDVFMHLWGSKKPVGGPAIWLKDWKSGKVKDGTPQAAAMAFVYFMKYPGADKIRVDIEYLKYAETQTVVFQRSSLPSILAPILETTKAIKECDTTGDWTPKESGLCGWCPVTDCPNWRQR